MTKNRWSYVRLFRSKFVEKALVFFCTFCWACDLPIGGHVWEISGLDWKHIIINMISGILYFDLLITDCEWFTVTFRNASVYTICLHDDVLKWKHFSRLWPLWGEFTRHRWVPLTKDSEAELWWVFFICPWINGWVNNREAGDLRCNGAHYDVTVMWQIRSCVMAGVCVITPVSISLWYQVLSQRTTLAPSQYPKRRLFVRSRQVSKPRDLYLELSDRSEIWQALRQQCCRCACQISKRYDNLKYQSRGFETYEKTSFRILRRGPGHELTPLSVWNMYGMSNWHLFSIPRYQWTTD